MSLPAAHWGNDVCCISSGADLSLSKRKSLASQIDRLISKRASLRLKISYHITWGQEETPGSACLQAFRHGELFVEIEPHAGAASTCGARLSAAQAAAHRGFASVCAVQTDASAGHFMFRFAFVPWCFRSVGVTVLRMTFQHRQSKGCSRNNWVLTHLLPFLNAGCLYIKSCRTVYICPFNPAVSILMCNKSLLRKKVRNPELGILGWCAGHCEPPDKNTSQAFRSQGFPQNSQLACFFLKDSVQDASAQGKVGLSWNTGCLVFSPLWEEDLLSTGCLPFIITGCLLAPLPLSCSLQSKMKAFSAACDALVPHTELSISCTISPCWMTQSTTESSMPEGFPPHQKRETTGQWQPKFPN